MYVLVVTTALWAAPGVAPPREAGWVVNLDMTSDQVRDATSTYKARGYRPIGVSAYNNVEANRFAVIYQKGPGPDWDLEWGLTTDQFLARARNLNAKGYVAESLAGCSLIGNERLSDLWVKQAGVVREATYGQSAADLRIQLDRMRARGYRPIRISSYMVNTVTVYAVIWEKGDAVQWELKFGLSGQGLQNALDDLSTRGCRPVSIGGHNSGGAVVYCAVWEYRKGPAWQMRCGLTQNDFLDLGQSMARTGFRPKAVVGFNTRDGVRFASLWEKEPTGR